MVFQSLLVNTMVKLHAGYAFTETFSAGAGFTYSSFTATPIIDVSVHNEINSSAWGLSLGLYYRDDFSLGGMNLTPQAGLSFNDLSTGFDDERFDITQPMPGQIRLAFGLDTRSEVMWMDRPAFSFGVYTSLNKYLARVDFDEETDEPNVPSGFEAVFTGWRPVSYFDGVQMQMAELSVGDQISASIGVEAGLAETLFLRFGRFGGAERWAESHTAFGAGIDFYFVSFDLTHIRYDETNDLVRPLQNATTFSVTARIPLDGQPRNTLLGRWFGR
jgi:hypothetical protein